ncbi:Polysaccharide biosynthesis protein [uncultured archaeon]|nr:Polysaccharide biosynthesis protein [uncultured archaeon]
MEDKILKHGSIIFFASFISIFLGYIFHFYMARALGPDDYGILGSIISFIYIFSVPSTVLATALAQVVAELKGEGAYGKIKSIVLQSIRKLVYISLVIFIMLVLFSPVLKKVLNLPSEFPVVLLGISLIFITILLSLRGVLQGLQEFNSLGLNMVLEKTVLLFIGVFLVYFGMGVNGAIIAYGFSALVVFLLALLPLKSILERKNEKIDISIYKYASPIIVLLFCITIMSNIDIFFVRTYFSAEVSGYFNAIKTLGMVVYFISLSLGMVLLPKVSEMSTLNKNQGLLLRKTLFYFCVLLGAILFSYAIASDTIITILFGSDYSSVSGYLVWYSLTMGFLSYGIILMVYDVSMKKTVFRYPLILFTLVQIFLLIVFHKTIDQIIIVQAAAFLMLLVVLVLIKKRYGTSIK